PQLQRANFRELAVQTNGDGSALPATARFEGRANRRQRGHPLRIDGHELARLVRQTNAGRVQRKLDRLGDEQIKLPLGELDCLSPPGIAWAEAERRRWDRLDSDVIRPRQRSDDTHA